MRIFRHWIRHPSRVSLPEGEQEVACWGGSDLSEDDARRDAERRLDAVRRRVAGQPDAEEYAADIREQLVQRLDPANAVTRNRYGALVLNSSDHLMIDIDEPRYRFWEAWFGLRDPHKRKRRIIEQVQARARAADCAGLGLRIYETHKGIRVLVGGRIFDPRARATEAFMRSFNADRLYTTLCRKQGCWRARLTPKPYRMKLRGHRVRWPRDPQQEAAFQAWLPGYEQASATRAACRFVQALGVELRSPVIEFHDAASGALSGRPLA